MTDSPDVMRFPVRLGNNVIMCPLNQQTGIIEVPLGAMVDVELTGLFTKILADCGVPEDRIEGAMNDLRVQYVMGPQARVEDLDAYVEQGRG